MYLREGGWEEVELERAGECWNLERRIFTIRMIRGNVTDAKLAVLQIGLKDPLSILVIASSSFF